MKNFLLKSVLFSIIFCLCLTATYFLIKARSTSKSTTDSNTTAIYADTNDTLTAAKRNTLVDKATRHDMDINNTTTAFNTGCERRWTWWLAMISPSMIKTDELRRKWSSADISRIVKSSNKNQTQKRDQSTTTHRVSTYESIIKLQYRCP